MIISQQSASVKHPLHQGDLIQSSHPRFIEKPRACLMIPLTMAQNSDYWKPIQQVLAMRSLVQIACQILSGRVKNPVPPFLPQKAVRHVIDLALVGDIRRSPILAVVLGEFLFCESVYPACLRFSLKRSGGLRFWKSPDS
jgi:hypothetical protein